MTEQARPVARNKKRRAVFFDEFSKVAVLVTFVYGIGNGIMYWVSLNNGFKPSDSVMHDSVQLILAPLLGYFMRTVFLKSSLNRHGLTLNEDGEPKKIDGAAG